MLVIIINPMKKKSNFIRNGRKKAENKAEAIYTVTQRDRQLQAVSRRNTCLSTYNMI